MVRPTPASGEPHTPHPPDSWHPPRPRLHGTPPVVQKMPRRVHETRHLVHAAPFRVHQTRRLVHAARLRVHAKPFRVHAKPFCVHAKPFRVHAKSFCVHAKWLREDARAPFQVPARRRQSVKRRPGPFFLPQRCGKNVRLCGLCRRCGRRRSKGHADAPTSFARTTCLVGAAVWRSRHTARASTRGARQAQSGPPRHPPRGDLHHPPLRALDFCGGGGRGPARSRRSDSNAGPRWSKVTPPDLTGTKRARSWPPATDFARSSHRMNLSWVDRESDFR